MKSHSIEWSSNYDTQVQWNRRDAGGLRRLLNGALRVSWSLLPGLALLIGSAWLVAQPDLVVFLQVTLWAAGFVFFGLAIDSRRNTAIAAAVSGLALPAFALLSSRIAPEIAVVGVAIVAAWMTIGFLRAGKSSV